MKTIHHLNNGNTILDIVFSKIKNNNILQKLLDVNAPHSKQEYFTILNENETIRGIPVGIGLCLFTRKPVRKIKFVKFNDIFKYLSTGVILKQVFLPTTNPDFYVERCYDKDKYYSNMVILGKKYDLRQIDTIQQLKSRGLDILDPNVIYWAAKNNCIPVVKYLLSEGANIKTAIYAASKYGKLDVIKSIMCDNPEIILTIIKNCVKDNHKKFIKEIIDNNKNILSPQEFNLLELELNTNIPSTKHKIIKTKSINSNKNNFVMVKNNINVENKNVLTKNNINFTPNLNDNRISNADEFISNAIVKENIIEIDRFIIEGQNIEKFLHMACILRKKNIIDYLINNKNADFESVHKNLVKYRSKYNCDDSIKYLASIIMTKREFDEIEDTCIHQPDSIIFPDKNDRDSKNPAKNLAKNNASHKLDSNSIGKHVRKIECSYTLNQGPDYNFMNQIYILKDVNIIKKTMYGNITCLILEDEFGKQYTTKPHQNCHWIVCDF
ncbi:ankyrin repeat-containing protein [Cotonvirus japonicus]|uniref:Ankyrin repeat-containing protein n=1 Tax=Cotonvirus japonicus TaxID=2811091 RepID=A0ABM7NU20_9VIRU|nr:ankyrin repeat-containing protein [Cotonvirus japonicus]BCS83673.1 ankyrin repeat-containing protein [Cotonvirus japonicus]